MLKHRSSSFQEIAYNDVIIIQSSISTTLKQEVSFLFFVTLKNGVLTYDDLAIIVKVKLGAAVSMQSVQYKTCNFRLQHSMKQLVIKAYSSMYLPPLHQLRALLLEIMQQICPSITS